MLRRMLMLMLLLMLMLHLPRDAGLQKGFMPVCLPPGRRFPDDSGQLRGYSEGWGTDSDTSGACLTGEEGPSPFSACQERTRLASRRPGRPGVVFHGCLKQLSPTARDRQGACSRLRDHLKAQSGGRFLLGEGVAVAVVISGQLWRECFHENRAGSRRAAGWCATCREEALPGEHGYCGGASKDREEEQLLNMTKSVRLVLTWH